MINEKFEAWNGAIVRLTNKLTGDTIVDSAAHVFEAVDGFAYLNPGYFYPETSHLSNYHRFDGVLSMAGGTIQFDGPEWSAYIEEWEATVEQQQQAGTALYYYENKLEELGIPYAQQRAKLLQTLARQLLEPIDSQ